MKGTPPRPTFSGLDSSILTTTSSGEQPRIFTTDSVALLMNSAFCAEEYLPSIGRISIVTLFVKYCVPRFPLASIFHFRVKSRRARSSLRTGLREKGTRCGHYEQVKIGPNWKCTSCGRILTIGESIQNALETADVLKVSIEARKPLNESMDELIGRKEWEEMRSNISTAKRHSRRKSTKPTGRRR